MQVRYDSITPTTTCGNCGDVDIVMLTVCGNSLHCLCGDFIDTIDSLSGTGILVDNLVRLE
jgi:hypothetical protein